MKTRKIVPGLVLTMLVLTTLACGLVDKAVNTATGGATGNMQTVTSLWSDVPKMDGLEASTMDMPLPIKLVINTVLGNLGKLNPQGSDQTTGKIDWIAFTSSKTPADLQNFYTNELMTKNGWDASDTSTCTSGSDQGISQVGAICVFAKSADSKQVQLAIIAVQDDTTKKLNVFFLRLEESPTPAPAQ